MKRTARVGIAAGLALAALLFGLPLLMHSGLPYGSDLGFASHSAWGFSEALQDGVLYPRWIGNSNRGFGGPTFLLYPPLAYYAAGLARILTGDLLLGFRLVLLLGAFLAGLAAWAALREITGRGAAMLGAWLYVLAPYHAIDLYDRFAFAEYMAFAWFPLIFLAARRLLSRPSSGAWVGLAAAYAGLVLTHLVTAFLVLFVLGPYVLFHLLRRRAWRSLPRLAAAGGLGLLAGAVFLVPMLAERSEVHTEFFVESSYGDWRRNFVYRDEVAHGFTDAPIKPWVNRAATAQGVLALAALLILVARSCLGNAPAREVIEEGWAQAVLSAWTLFLQVPLSAPIWSLVPGLGTVQFPWRFSLFQALSAATLAACAVAPARQAPTQTATAQPHDAPPRARALAAAAILVAALPGLWLSARLTVARDFNFDERIFLYPRVFSRVMEEYMPRDFEGWQDFKTAPFALTSPPQLPDGGRAENVGWQPHTRLLRVTAGRPGRLQLPTFGLPGFLATVNGRETPVLPLPGGIEIRFPAGRSEIRLQHRAAALAGPGRLEVRRWGAAERRLHVISPAANRLVVRTFAYPGWEATIDGVATAIETGNRMHAVEIAVPAGDHDVRLRFVAAANRQLGAGLSLAAVAIMAAYEWRRRRRSPQI